MASPSSSMSQESLDHEEGDDSFTNRARSRNIRLLRARGAHRTDRDNGDCYDTRESPVQNGDVGEGEGCGGGGVMGDHESTARTLAPRDRPKDKRTRPNHLQRGKLPKDKRKLREKRRSTGVVHLQSTESTGDSLDDEDTDKERPVMETSRNTKYNEIIDADNPQTPSESHGRKSFAARRNKSPSDLEADLEDNQDYDSTVSQSECNIVLIDQKDPVTSYSKPTPAPVSQHTTRAHGYSKIGYGLQPTSVRGESQTKTSYVASVLSTFPASETNRPRHSSVLSRYQPDRKQDTTYKLDYGLRYRDRDNSATGSSINRVQLPKENLNNSKSTSSYSSRQTESQSSQVEMLKEENRRLEKLLEEKNRKIGELEDKISVLNQQVMYVNEQNDDLKGENSALLRALTRLTT